MQYKIAVLGASQRLAVFRNFGMDTFALHTPLQAQAVFETLLKEDYAVLCLEEGWLECLRPEVERCVGRTLPAVVLLPEAGGNSTVARARLAAAIYRAVGANLGEQEETKG